MCTTNTGSIFCSWGMFLTKFSLYLYSLWGVCVVAVAFCHSAAFGLQCQIYGRARKKNLRSRRSIIASAPSPFSVGLKFVKTSLSTSVFAGQKSLLFGLVGGGGRALALSWALLFYLYLIYGSGHAARCLLLVCLTKPSGELAANGKR